MPRTTGKWTDERMDQIIGNLLRIGVAAAAAIVLVGGIYYLIQHGAAAPDYQAFHGEPKRLRSISEIIITAFSLRSRSIIQLGLLLLILTPIARVVFSVFAFALQRDRTYVVATLIVLGILVYNIIGGYR